MIILTDDHKLNWKPVIENSVRICRILNYYVLYAYNTTHSWIKSCMICLNWGENWQRKSMPQIWAWSTEELSAKHIKSESLKPANLSFILFTFQIFMSMNIMAKIFNMMQVSDRKMERMLEEFQQWERPFTPSQVQETSLQYMCTPTTLTYPICSMRPKGTQ